MGFIEVEDYCPVCDSQVRIHKQTVNYLLHVLCFLIAAPIWIIVVIRLRLKYRPWHCTRCGRFVKMDAEGESSLDYTMNWLVNSTLAAAFCVLYVLVVVYFIVPGFRDLISTLFEGPIIIP